jgi:hypothetical protein
MAEEVFEDKIPADKITMSFGLVRSDTDNAPQHLVPGTSSPAFSFLLSCHCDGKSLMLDTNLQGSGKWLTSCLNGT